MAIVQCFDDDLGVIWVLFYFGGLFNIEIKGNIAQSKLNLAPTSESRSQTTDTMACIRLDRSVRQHHQQKCKEINL